MGKKLTKEISVLPAPTIGEFTFEEAVEFGGNMSDSPYSATESGKYCGHRNTKRMLSCNRAPHHKGNHSTAPEAAMIAGCKGLEWANLVAL